MDTLVCCDFYCEQCKKVSAHYYWIKGGKFSKVNGTMKICKECDIESPIIKKSETISSQKFELINELMK